MKKVIINPAVPPELRELVESATAALKTHTAEGKAILLTELRKRYDEAIKDFQKAGADKATPDEKIHGQMVAAYIEAHGEDNKKKAAQVFAAIYNKATWEGLMYGVAIFMKFKDEVLTENEKS